MKMSKIISLGLGLVVFAQALLCLSNFYDKLSIATDSSLKTLELKVPLPRSYAWKKDSSIGIIENLKIDYNEADPLVEKLDFTRKTKNGTVTLSNINFGAKKGIFILLKEEGDKLIIDGYSTKKPKDQLYLKGYATGVSKNAKGELKLTAYILDLKRFNVEGDKYQKIHEHIEAANNFNHALSLELSNKKITKEESKERQKKALIVLRIGENGKIFVKDFIVDEKSLRYDF